ncbi:hypothetical protein Bhyg_11188 [Pseudolycoriella hygida]|uniref:Uncharacterized protein n=1 Tax=Pseudolycoriella hygida TaxID=35572 RepID=A0A9Q0MUX3_9DIPT|nr:hypothetical protein Bhyg_11188 [Pseudolycoriella hygida]
MNFLSRQTNLRQLIGRMCRSCSDIQVASFSRSSKLMKEPTNKATTKDDQLNKPVEYFGSKAASWTAKQSHYNPNYDEDLWYQPFVISGSLMVFMAYFFIFREENDVDEKLTVSLYDRIEGLEEHQLEQSLKYNKSKGLSTLELENRLKELRETGK